ARVPGVSEASVNLATERATVTFDPRAVTLTDMEQAVARAGYGAQPIAEPVVEPTSEVTPDVALRDAGEPGRDEAAERRRAELERRRNTLLLGIALSIPVVV